MGTQKCCCKASKQRCIWIQQVMPWALWHNSLADNLFGKKGLQQGKFLKIESCWVKRDNNRRNLLRLIVFQCHSTSLHFFLRFHSKMWQKYFFWGALSSHIKYLRSTFKHWIMDCLLLQFGIKNLSVFSCLVKHLHGFWCFTWKVWKKFKCCHILKIELEIQLQVKFHLLQSSLCQLHAWAILACDWMVLMFVKWYLCYYLFDLYVLMFISKLAFNQDNFLRTSTK